MSLGNSAKFIAGTNTLYNAKVGSGFVGILDLYPSASAAYSVRKLSSTYTGNSIRVRRSSDNAEQDIGFDSLNNLDEAALSAFIGVHNGFITVWYDQSGNNNNAVQANATRQPHIVMGGTIIKVNNKAAIQFPQNNLHWLNLTNPITPATENLQYFVAERDHLNKIFTGLSTSGFNGIYTNNVIYVIAKEFYFGGTNTYLGQLLWLNDNRSIDYDLYINDVNTPITINYTYNANYTYISNYYFEGQSGKFQELILWNFNRSSDKSGITTNINNYYGIF